MEVSKSFFGQMPKMPWKEDEDAIQKQKTKGVDAHSRTRNRKKVGQEIWRESKEDYEEEGT
jgi:hypothetical protein